MKMKMSKIVLWSLILTLALGANVALAKGKPGDSLQPIRDAINVLQQQVASLQQQIDNIQLIPGPQGEQGIQGEPGQNGTDGQPGEQGSVGPQGPAGPSLKVIDANNNEVGLLISRGFSGYEVWNSTLQKLLDVDKFSGILQFVNVTNGVRMLYESYDCTGQPLLASSSVLGDIDYYKIYMLGLNRYGWTHVVISNVIRDEVEVHSNWEAGLGTCLTTTTVENALSITPIDPPPTFVGPLRIIEQ